MLFLICRIELSAHYNTYLFHILRTYVLRRNNSPITYIITAVIAILIYLLFIWAFSMVFNAFFHVFLVEFLEFLKPST